MNQGDDDKLNSLVLKPLKFNHLKWFLMFNNWLKSVNFFYFWNSQVLKPNFKSVTFFLVSNCFPVIFTLKVFRGFYIKVRFPKRPNEIIDDFLSMMESSTIAISLRYQTREKLSHQKLKLINHTILKGKVLIILQIKRLVVLSRF